MDPSDFDKVEQQLLHHLNPISNALRETRGLQGAHGWSTAALGELVSVIKILFLCTHQS